MPDTHTPSGPGPATAEMDRLMAETPIFVDALAATTKWGRPDAAAHFIELRDITDEHQVETFIEFYGDKAA